MNTGERVGSGDTFLGYHLRVVEEKLDSILAHLHALSIQGAHLMAKMADVNAKLDIVTAGISGIAGDVTDLKAQIEALKNAGDGATAAEVDALFDRVSGIADTVTALDAQTPQA